MAEDNGSTSSAHGASIAAASRSRKRRILDSDGIEVTAGCVVSFSYGIPPVGVCAPVIQRGRSLIAITAGHNPHECDVSELMGHVCDFWICQQDWHVRAWRDRDFQPTPTRKRKTERPRTQ